MTAVAIIPRIIRLRDAPLYLGMDKNRFNAEVRPHLQEFPIGIQGIGFDRVDLDAYAEEYIVRNGRKRETQKERKSCQNAQPASRSLKVVKSGTSTKGSVITGDFAKALEAVRTPRQKNT